MIIDTYTHNEAPGLGLRSVRDRMVHLPDFPVAIAPLGGQHKIWKAAEVKGWLNRRRER